MTKFDSIVIILQTQINNYLVRIYMTMLNAKGLIGLVLLTINDLSVDSADFNYVNGSIL